MSVRAYRALEGGEARDPHFSTLSKLSRALGVSVAELVGEQPEGRVPLAEAPERRAWVLSLGALYTRFASKVGDLPDPPKDDIERVRINEALSCLVNEFYTTHESLDEAGITNEAGIRDRLRDIATKPLPLAREWLGEYGDLSQLEQAEKTVAQWEAAERATHPER
jgi:hypothetical protein